MGAPVQLGGRRIYFLPRAPYNLVTPLVMGFAFYACSPPFSSLLFLFFCLLYTAYACTYGCMNSIVGTCQTMVQRESFFAITCETVGTRSVTSLGHQEGRRVFWERPKFFELCPIFSNYIQHIFPGGAKNFLGGASPPWLQAWDHLNYAPRPLQIGMKKWSMQTSAPHCRLAREPRFILFWWWTGSTSLSDLNVHVLNKMLWPFTTSTCTRSKPFLAKPEF